MQKRITKVALYLYSEADYETCQRFFEAAGQISEILDNWMSQKNQSENPGIKIGAVENWDVSDSVVWVSIYSSEHVLICKSIAKLILERHRVGDKYKIMVNPKPSLG